MTNYLSTRTPAFTPHTIDCGKISAYPYKGNLQDALKRKLLTKAQAIAQALGGRVRIVAQLAVWFAVLAFVVSCVSLALILHSRI